MSLFARRWNLALLGLAGLAVGCQRAAPTPPTAAVPTSAPRATDAVAAAPAPTATTKPAPVGPPREISFDDIKFEMAVGSAFDRKLLTPAIEATDGQRVRIRGYILPSFKQTGIEEFVLVRDNMQCCFGPGAALYDCIVVRMRPGAATDYTVRPVSVMGTFAIREWRDEFSGKHLAIYHLDGEQVE